MNEKDPLFAGAENITKDFQIPFFKTINNLIDTDEKFIIPQSVRFRKEDGFSSINIRWANAISIETETAELLARKQSSSESFSINEIDRIDRLSLIFKGAIIPENKDSNISPDIEKMKGCSVNPRDLPDLFDVE
jgi:hypothetical protein